MSKEDAAVLTGRALAVLFTVWALSEVSFLPEGVYSLVRYAYRVPVTSEWTDYQRHHYLMDVAFRVTRIIGFALIARWLHKGGPEVLELLLPSEVERPAGGAGR